MFHDGLSTTPDFLNVKQLVDESQHVLSMTDNHFAQLFVVLGIAFAAFQQLLACPKDNGQRGLQLVGDIGEEVRPHGLGLALHVQGFLTSAPGNKESANHGRQHQDKRQAAPLYQFGKKLALLVYLVLLIVDDCRFHHLHPHG